MPTLVHQINIAIMTFAPPLSRLTWAMAALACMAMNTDLHAQRSGSKSANIELTTIPTVPYEMVDKVAFFIHADQPPRRPRRYGGNIKIIKDGERLEGMAHSLGKEVQRDDMPTCIVDVALAQTSSSANPTSSPAPSRVGQDLPG